MLIDIHIHSSEYSHCSNLKLEDAVVKAKTLGLDGICVTDHDSNGVRKKASSLSKEYDFLIIVGIEYYTYNGELLLFGLDDIPTQRMHAEPLIELVSKRGGISVVPHPFRDKGRGMGEYLMNLNGISGVEAFNGLTNRHDNYSAFSSAKELGLPCLGGSDTHFIENVGQYATVLPDGIRNEKEFIEAVKKGSVSPALYDPKEERFKVAE